jgi:thymidylate synthase (FAD)
MKIVKQSHEILSKEVEFDLALDRIEEAGRLCYKSKKSKTVEARNAFIEGMVKKGHHSVIEHFNFSVRFITNRGVTHELVRHRLSSYSQESTRWCNYTQDRFGEAEKGGELTYILPVWFYDIHEHSIATEKDTNLTRRYWNWRESLNQDEVAYFIDAALGAKPEEARGILPNDLKTEIDMTCNVREWRHVFKERLFNTHAHPQIRKLMYPLFLDIKAKLEPLFSDMILLEAP